MHEGEVMIAARWWRWLTPGLLIWGSAGCLPLDLELEVLYASEAVGNSLLFRDSAVFAAIQELFF